MEMLKVEHLMVHKKKEAAATENWTSIKAYAELPFLLLYRGNFLVNFIKLKRVEKREQRNEHK